MKNKIDIRNILEIPQIYNFWQTLVGNNRFLIDYINNAIKPQNGNKILDIGCGTARILNFLPKDVDYTGIDISSEYISKAKNIYKERGKFLNIKFDVDEINNLSDYDIVLLNGVLHHLTDYEAEKIIELANKALKPNGRLISYEGCYTNEQSLISKVFLSLDRGEYIRTKDGYFSLISKYFNEFYSEIKDNTHLFPYTMIIMQWYKS